MKAMDLKKKEIAILQRIYFTFPKQQDGSI